MKYLQRRAFVSYGSVEDWAWDPRPIGEFAPASAIFLHLLYSISETNWKYFICTALNCIAVIHNNTLNKQHSQLSLLTPQFENILKYSHKHYKKYPVSTLHYRHVLVCVKYNALHYTHKFCIKVVMSNWNIKLKHFIC